MIKTQKSVSESHKVIQSVLQALTIYVDEDVLELIQIGLNVSFRNYGYSEYNFLPIYTTETITEAEYFTIIGHRMLPHLCKYLFLFNEMYIENLNKTVIPKQIEYTDINKRTLDITDTKKGTNTRIDDDEDVNRSMNEISPINADINNITTPNNKTYIKTETDKTRTDNIDETMTNTGTDNLEKSGSRSDPSTFKEFIELIEKYNIRNILDRICRSVIAEFNTSI